MSRWAVGKSWIAGLSTLQSEVNSKMCDSAAAGDAKRHVGMGAIPDDENTDSSLARRLVICSHRRIPVHAVNPSDLTVGENTDSYVYVGIRHSVFRPTS